MAHWDNNYIGIKLYNKEHLKFAKEIFDCWDIQDEQDYYLHGELGETAFGEDWDIFGKGSGLFYVFGILSKLFGKIKACEVEDMGNTVTDGLVYSSKMYDSGQNKYFEKNVNYDWGAGLVGGFGGFGGREIHDVLKWEDIKDVIEKEVEKLNNRIIEKNLSYPPTTVAWIQGDKGIEPDPDNEDFKSLCDDVFYDEFSFDEYGTETDEGFLDEKDFEIDQEILSDLIETATSKGYVELVAFILERINAKDEIEEETIPNKAYEPVEKIDYSERVVVTTGLSLNDEAWVKEQVEERGGIFKENFVKSLNVLVINPDYDHETTKLKKTKELIAEGRNARIITFEEFKKML